MEDEHAHALLVALRKSGVAAALLDAAVLEGSNYVLTSTGFEFESDGQEFVISPANRPRGFVRRLAPEDWLEQAAPASYEGAVRSAFLTLLLAGATCGGVEWLSPLEAMLNADNKMVQLVYAERAGIRVPVSVVTSVRERIPENLGDRLVAKPLGPGSFVDEGGAHVVYAAELPRHAPALDALAGAPFLLQERLTAELHLRVVTVRDRAWVCELRAGELPLDWRQADEAHGAFAETKAWPTVAEQALKLASLMRTRYSSQDWIVAGGTAVFLDLNPGGQWLFLPASVAAEVTAAIAEWLAGPAR